MGVKRYPWKNLAGVVLCCFMVAMTGCGRERLQTEYGRRTGATAAKSVNGTAVLAGMFEQAGHRVSSWRTLSPRLKEQADCIVWFPDDFGPPSAQVRSWLETWLQERPNRTLIYVGRDFDAATWYWEKMKAVAPADKQGQVEGSRADARAAFDRARGTPSRTRCPWFTLEPRPKTRQVRTLTGGDEWSEDIVPAELEIELNSRLEPAEQADVLLHSTADALVSRLEYSASPPMRPRNPSGKSQLLLVANGSFLLNAALVNHEHRKLAGRLIDAVGPPRRSVFFLESGAGGPPIRETDPKVEMPTGLKALNEYPTNWVLLHFAAIGIILCFWRWPIFGLALPPERPGTSDFGKHVDAVAALLRRSRDRAYALSRLTHYQQTIKD
jgi:hypothetical protein